MKEIKVWKIETKNDQKIVREMRFPQDLCTLDMISEVLPGGAYTTFRTYGHNRVLYFDDHLRRLESTAKLAGNPVFIDHYEIRTYVRQIIKAFPDQADLRIRISIDLEDEIGKEYLLAEILKIPSEIAYQTGVKAITCDFQRINPKAKLTLHVSETIQIRRNLPPDANEALLVNNNGCILEGLSSNFFAVINGELWTAEKGVLSGITRRITLEEANHLGLKVRFAPISVKVLPDIEEAFITSSSRGILPCKQIDKIRIGAGKPGEITKQLMTCYLDRINDQVREI
jgi:branched-chain amino acid aminotransferase